MRPHDVICAGIVVALEHLLPGQAAICRLVDASFASRPEEWAGRGHEHHVVVHRIDDDPVDGLRTPESDVLERAASVGRLVDTFAPRRALPIVGLAGADPDHIGIRLRHRNGADRKQPLVLKQRRVRRAVVRGLPDTAVRRGDVVDGRVGLIDGQVRNPARVRGRPNGPEVQVLELHGDRSRRGRLAEEWGADHAREQYAAERGRAKALQHRSSGHGRGLAFNRLDWLDRLSKSDPNIVVRELLEERGYRRAKRGVELDHDCVQCFEVGVELNRLRRRGE